MTDNPFETGNDAPADPWASTSTDTIPRPQEAPPVAVKSDNEISVTLKQHGGFDSPWIVVRGPSAAQVKELLRDLYAEDLVDAVAQTAVKFADSKPAGASVPAPRQGGGGYQRTGGGGQQASTPPPGASQPSCDHGPMEFKTGVSKKGNSYKVWSCTSPDRDNQCKGIFVK
ncbi:hypothetical protein [Actinomadura sp. WMMB 499]|uniref:hypothetical protein n=1 Tax=Actinomadura sp. WMMB 499 TaxID=1219491 RepID=UPI00124655EC|nr:hypothetical protein [Actinomadura sp. WMMB 499]QFG25470.1 hypothetical protein F7P10_34330 [Actinomadura sp. WMMB 499]